MAFWHVSLLAIVTLATVQACLDQPKCAPLWSRYKENCYRFFSPVKTWDAAEEHCQQFFSQSGQGHLASVHSKDEDNLLRALSQTSVRQTPFSVWLGANDNTVEGEYRWSDGSVLDYVAWMPNQPDNYNSRREQENCLALRFLSSVDGFNDGICHGILPYICKMPASQ